MEWRNVYLVRVKCFLIVVSKMALLIVLIDIKSALLVLKLLLVSIVFLAHRGFM
jgi:hypothetical protein